MFQKMTFQSLDSHRIYSLLTGQYPNHNEYSSFPAGADFQKKTICPQASDSGRMASFRPSQGKEGVRAAEGPDR